MDYLYANLAILVSAVLVLSCGQTESQNHTHRRMIAITRHTVVKVKKVPVKGSWICIATHCEKFASEALRHGSQSF